MARLQLALNVTDLHAAIEFYAQLFDTPPHKRRPGYANFAIADPPLKLVLIEGTDRGATLNHLGVEVHSSDDVAAAATRLGDAGMAVDVRDGEVCCYARQDKVWVTDPDGAHWEVYAVTDDAPQVAETLPLVTCCSGAGAAVGDEHAPRR